MPGLLIVLFKKIFGDKPAAKNLLHLLLQVAGHVAERVKNPHLLLALLLLLPLVSVLLHSSLEARVSGVSIYTITLSAMIVCERNLTTLYRVRSLRVD